MVFWTCWWHPHRKHRRQRVHPVLRIGNVAVELIAWETIHMALTENVGQTSTLSIHYWDATGAEITAPVLDSPASWSQTTPATDTLTASADGNSATVVGLAAGSDTVQVQVMVGGKQFSATIDVTVAASAPALDHITIEASTPA
jgi:hypothetical protein